jgi:hypothetical protein
MSDVQAGIGSPRTVVRVPADVGSQAALETVPGSVSLLSTWQRRLAQAIYEQNSEPESPLRTAEGEIDPDLLQQAVDRTLKRLAAACLLQHVAEAKGQGARDNRADEHELKDRLNERFSTIHQSCGASLFAPGHICDRIRIPDPILSDVVHWMWGLIHAGSPVDLLGRMHAGLLERRLILESNEVQTIQDSSPLKSGGVYYTPRHVVRCMVERTLGRWLYGTVDGQPDGEQIPGRSRLGAPQISGEDGRPPLRVLDPAAGSGAFICCVFDLLADFYAQAAPHELAADHVRRILRDHLYGIDLDAEAVAVAEVNLLLRVLAHLGGWSETQGVTLDTRQNIRTGNSLITGAPQTLERFFPDPSEKLPFNWESEFPEVFNPDLPGGSPGFSVVVGNPPYVFGEHIPSDEKLYYTSNYETARGQFDLYWLFYERCSDLVQRDGYLGFVVPDAFTVRDEAAVVREHLLRQGALEEVLSIGPVFAVPDVSAVVTIWRKSEGQPEPVIVSQLNGEGAVQTGSLEHSTLSSEPGFRLPILVPPALRSIFRRMRSVSDPLSEYTDLSRGEELGRKDLQPIRGRPPSASVPILIGRDVSRYAPPHPSHSIQRDRLRKEEQTGARPKILVVKTGSRVVATLDTQGYSTLQSLYNVVPERQPYDGRFLLAVICSTPVQAFVAKSFLEQKRVFPQLNQSQLAQIPVPRVDPCAGEHSRLADLAQRMLDLTGVLQAVSKESAALFDAGAISLSTLLAKAGVKITPLTSPDRTGEVQAIALTEIEKGLLIRGQIEGRWQDIAALQIEGEDQKLFLLLAGRTFLKRHRRRRVWSRGRIVQGILDGIQLPLAPDDDRPVLLESLRSQLPSDLNCHGIGLDRQGAPLHVSQLEAALIRTDEEIDRLVGELYGISAQEQLFVRQCLDGR